MHLVLLVKVTAKWKKEKKKGPLLLSGCLMLLHGFSVALKSLLCPVPLTMHVDPGWLLPSVSPYIYIYTYIHIYISLSPDTVSVF